MEIYRFRELLGQPQVNGDMRRDWNSLEMHSGVNFPDDYKEFVSAYGPGCLNGQLYVFHPRASGDEEGLGLQILWEQASYAYADLSLSFPEVNPFFTYPTAGGLIPIARSISGNYVFLTPPERDGADWSVTLDVGQWVSLPLSFTDCLWAALRGELEAPLLQGEPMFDPIGTVQI